MSTPVPAPVAGAYPPLEQADAAVILPTLNEEHGLAATLDDIPFAELEESGWKVAPLVIDGGSTDGTRDIARRRGLPWLDQRSRGKGAAIREAFDYLRERGVRFAVVLDADHTYPGSAIGPVLALLASGSQLVVGVRRPADTPFANLRDLVHRLGNGLLNWTAWQMSRRPILDTCSGMYGVDTRAVGALELESPGFEIEAELFLKAHRAGLMVTQIPIGYRERLGTPKLHAGRDGARILLAILRYGPRRRSADAAGELPLGEPSLLRALLSICFVHGADEVLLFCPPSRRDEGRMLSTRLSESRISPNLVVAPYERLANAAVGLPPAAASVGENGPLVVALPSEPMNGTGGRPHAVAVLPRTRRMVYVTERDAAPASKLTSVPTDGHASRPKPGVPGVRLEVAKRETARRYGNPLRALWTGLDARSPTRELALLVANSAIGESVTVWREATRGRPPRLRP